MSDNDATGHLSGEEDFAGAVDPVEDEVVAADDAEIEDDDLFGDGDEPEEEPGYVTAPLELYSAVQCSADIQFPQLAQA